jgi:tetratricopeptide (TPR) repeat protein
VGILVALMVAIATYGLFFAQTETPAGSETRRVAPPPAPTPIDMPEGSFDPPEPRERMSEQDKAKALISEYDARLALNPDDPDAAAVLMSMGNLARQKLQNYEQAAHYYRQIITDFPDADNIEMAYIQLGTCYERMDDKPAARRLYRDMRNRFPEGSAAHEFAAAQYGKL